MLKIINLNRKNNSRLRQLIRNGGKAGVAEPGQTFKGQDARDSRSKMKEWGIPSRRGTWVQIPPPAPFR